MSSGLLSFPLFQLLQPSCLFIIRIRSRRLRGLFGRDIMTFPGHGPLSAVLSFALLGVSRVISSLAISISGVLSFEAIVTITTEAPRISISGPPAVTRRLPSRRVPITVRAVLMSSVYGAVSSAVVVALSVSVSIPITVVASPPALGTSGARPASTMMGSIVVSPASLVPVILLSTSF